MEIIYPILAFIVGGIIIFLWQQKRMSDLRSAHAALPNEAEKLGLAKLAEAEMSKSLAEQQLSTLSRDFTEVKTDLAAERQKNEESITIAHNLNGGTGSCKKAADRQSSRVGTNPETADDRIRECCSQNTERTLGRIYHFEPEEY